MNMFEKILVPIDGSELSDGAVEQAIEYCRRSGAAMDVLYVRPRTPIAHPVAFADYSAADDDTRVLTPATYRKRLEDYGHGLLAAVAKKCEAAGVHCDTLLEANDEPHEAIVKTAKERGAGMVFMASRGRTGLKSMLLGSETQKVIANSTLPVLVFR